MTVFDVAAVLFGRLVTVMSGFVRTPRTIIVLVALTIAFVAAGLLGIPGSSVVRLGLVCVCVVAFSLFPHRLAGIPHAHWQFDGQLRRMMRPVDVAHQRWLKSHSRSDVAARREARAATAAACRAAITTLHGLPSPDDRWKATVEALHRYLAALEGVALVSNAGPNPALDERANAEIVLQREQADQAWQAALRR